MVDMFADYDLVGGAKGELKRVTVGQTQWSEF